MSDALFDALNGSTSEGAGLTVAVAENGTPAFRTRRNAQCKTRDDRSACQASGRRRQTQRMMKKKLKRPSLRMMKNRLRQAGGAASSGRIGDDMDGACFKNASEAPDEPLEVTDKEGGRIPLRLQTDSSDTQPRRAGIRQRLSRHWATTPPPRILKLCSTAWRRNGWKPSVHRSLTSLRRTFPTATSMKASK